MQISTDGYGFTVGPVRVTLDLVDHIKGRVCLQIKTEKTTLEIWVSKNGRVSIIDSQGNEWRTR
jgi:hypothetical protein